jgi:hypothetical protein
MSLKLTQPDDLIDALEPVVRAFRELGIRHFIGGSIASSFHGATRSTMDVIVSRGRPFDKDSMRRATQERIGTTRTLEVPIATAEDSIVSKLEWDRLTEETSERQWNDVTRLVRLLGDHLDITYLRHVSDTVGVRNLLDRLLSQT